MKRHPDYLSFLVALIACILAATSSCTLRLAACPHRQTASVHGGSFFSGAVEVATISAECSLTVRSEPTAVARVMAEALKNAGLPAYVCTTKRGTVKTWGVGSLKAGNIVPAVSGP